MISPTRSSSFAKSSICVSGLCACSLSFRAPPSFFASPVSPLAAAAAASAFCFSTMTPTFFMTSFSSSLAKSVPGFSVTFVPEGYRPKVSSVSKSRSFVFSCSAIFSAVSGMKGASSEAPMMMPSVRLYITVESRSAFAGSFARIHGSVSSIYLLRRLNTAKISFNASETRRPSISFETFPYADVQTALRSSSTGSSAPLLHVTPPKYLLLIDTVLLTRLPSVFARSLLKRSVTSSHVITPSCSNGISCKTK